MELWANLQDCKTAREDGFSSEAKENGDIERKRQKQVMLTTSPLESNAFLMVGMDSWRCSTH